MACDKIDQSTNIKSNVYQYNTTSNQNIIGGDYTPYCIKDATTGVLDCQYQCSNIDDCTGYDYVPSNGDNGPKCFLKKVDLSNLEDCSKNGNTLPCYNNTPGTNSGIKSDLVCPITTRNNEKRDYKTMDNLQIIGGDIGSGCFTNQTSESECQLICDNTKDCSGYDYLTLATKAGGCLPNQPCCILKTGDISSLEDCSKNGNIHPCINDATGLGGYGYYKPSSGGGDDDGGGGDDSGGDDGSKTWIYVLIAVLIIVFIILVAVAVAVARKGPKSKGGRPLNCVDINPYGY